MERLDASAAVCGGLQLLMCHVLHLPHTTLYITREGCICSVMAGKEVVHSGLLQPRALLRYTRTTHNTSNMYGTFLCVRGWVSGVGVAQHHFSHIRAAGMGVGRVVLAGVCGLVAQQRPSGACCHHMRPGL